MVRCIMSDYGNVLMCFDTQRWYDFVRSRRRPFRSVIEPENLFKLEYVAEFERGCISRHQFVAWAKSILGLAHISDEEFLDAYSRIMHPDRKIIALMRCLKQNGFKMVMVSNINVFHYNYTKKHYPEVFEPFDYLMLSFQHGFIKPDHRMWEMPARNLNVLPEECFFIDDLMSNFIVFMEWSGQLGTAHHLNMTDERFCSNNRREVETNRLVIRMFGKGMLTAGQASEIMKLNF